MSATPKTGLALLREPFPAHQISQLPKPYKADSPKGDCKVCGGYHGLPAMHLDYVGHAALTDRLLDADPNWAWEPLGFTPDGLPALDREGGLWIKLTVCGVSRLGYGHAGAKKGGDAVKEMIGDALRNAAMRFGAALDLWHKGQLHADEDEDGKKPAAPTGYADWLTTLKAAAEKGAVALREEMKRGKREQMAYLKEHDGDTLTVLTDTAKAVKPAASAA